MLELEIWNFGNEQEHFESVLAAEAIGCMKYYDEMQRWI